MESNKNSAESKTVDAGASVNKTYDTEKTIALGGNPNVGKSTVFNGLTGLKQHTGNWPGKTVNKAQGYYTYGQNRYVLIDLPGCYSLMANSAEEEVARDFICFGSADAVVIVCDATCLERNLNIVLQTIEMHPAVIVCVNLMDEAAKKKITVDLKKMSDLLGVPVVGASARSKKGLDSLMQTIDETVKSTKKGKTIGIHYPDYIENAISKIERHLKDNLKEMKNYRWLSLMLLYWDDEYSYIDKNLNQEIIKNENTFNSAIDLAKEIKSDLINCGITENRIKDDMAAALITTAEKICKDVVIFENEDYKNKDLKIDNIIIGKWTAFPIMLLILAGIFWLTITGANYPSQMISKLLFWGEDQLITFFQWINAPSFLYEMLVLGVYRVLAWVVSVMLPPMAIFFPLFTLMEDIGILPRIAFNLDKCFKKCHACGKQALTMCMGFGCNAAGVIGCRIIDSPRERLIAVITNNFVPCNGRFPALIAVISIFFAGTAAGFKKSFLSAAILTIIIVLSIFMTLVASKLLSKTILKGVPSSFTLELPPYRKPQFGKVIIRSVFDRTLFVLGRAAAVAAPAGLLIWLMANITIYDASLLTHCSEALDPFAKMLGLDGVILIAFILGFPANEIVIPIMIMAYMANGNILEFNNLQYLKEILQSNGWTWVTAVSVMLFSLMHWPCSTTCLTIKKETQSIKWTAISFAVPTVMGVTVCFIFTSAVKIFAHLF